MNLNITKETGTLKIQTERYEMIAESFGGGIRIYASSKDYVDYMPVISKTGTEKPTVSVDDSRGVLENGNTKVEFEVADGSLTLTFCNSKNEVLLKTATADYDFKQIENGEYSLKTVFQVPENEKLFGMGQYQHGKFDLKNAVIPLYQENRQASIPYVISTAGYGFFWHNPAIGQAEFQKDKMIWTADCTEKLDFWVVAADTPKELVREYVGITGKPPMMPEFAMGFWQCRLRYWNQQMLLDVAREYNRRGMPLDVIVCDFYHYPTLGDMKFDEELFPNPEAMVKELKAMGTEFVISFWPHTEIKSDTYREMEERGLLPETKGGLPDQGIFGTTAFFDMSNPETVKYVWEKCKTNYYDKGIKYYWLDEIEPTISRKDFESHTLKMGKLSKIGNLYPLLCEKAFYDCLTAEGETEIVNLSRCAWAGSQKYGALVWPGDEYSTFESFKLQVIAGQQIGLSGISWWNTDIGGFSTLKPKSFTFRDLLVRWFQYGTFSPVMRLHGDRCPEYTPKKKDGTELFFAAQPNEIWSYGKRIEKIMIKYIEIRKAMLPYTKQLFKEAHEQGDPIIRTLFYEFPEDERCQDICDEYLYGGDMLVAPIFKRFARKRAVYLPKGAKWQSAIDGKMYEGGQTVTVKAKLDQIPVFARNGKHYELVCRIGKK
ncbi:MAG: TIM-barrel domain-containing protein [Candidatus Fimenecus sp.]